MYAFVLRERASAQRLPQTVGDTAAEPVLTPEGRAILGRARAWYRVSGAVISGLAAVVFVVKVGRGIQCIDALIEHVCWALLMLGGWSFETGDVLAIGHSPRSTPEALGFALRTMRNRLALGLVLLGTIILFL